MPRSKVRHAQIDWKLISARILNDRRFATLNDHLYRIAFSFLMICDRNGYLPGTSEMASLLCITESDLSDSIDELERSELVYRRDDGLVMDTRHVLPYQMLRMEWMEIRKEMTELVFKRDGKFCRRCGTIDDLTIDHIFPLIRGGESNLENLQVLCRPCNSSKGGK